MKSSIPAEEVRVWNMRFLAEELGGVSKFAEKLERSQSQISQLIGKNPNKTVERRLARIVEQKCRRPSGWLDAPHVTDWLKIERTDWRAGLRRSLLQYGISIDAAPTRNEEAELELCTRFRLLDEKDQTRLLDIARVFVERA